MRFRCLVLDHDDTVVNSTASIHYPSFLAYLASARPGLGEAYTLEDYFRKNFEPGILPLFTEEIGLTEQEVQEEFEFWQNYVRSRVPAAYPGIREILERFRAGGGLITVVSHSMNSTIERDYRQNDLPLPDLIFGWELPPEKRKPNPWPLQQIMKIYDLQPQELLMLDDLKPGYDCARACGVPFAASGWANNVPEIESFMRTHCDYYFKSVAEFSSFLFET